MARNITGDSIHEGKYVGFNLDAFGPNDDYFSTTGDYYKNYASVGVQGLRSSSLNRKNGISLVEMFDVGILGMPTITAFVNHDDIGTGSYNKIPYRMAIDSGPFEQNIPNIKIGDSYTIDSYHINSYYDKGSHKYKGIQSIADVFSIFSDNFDLIGHLLSHISRNISSSSSTANLGDLPERVETLENLLGATGTDTTTVIDRYNEIKNWFDGVQKEPNGGYNLISTVAHINSAYISRIQSGDGSLCTEGKYNAAYLYGSNITLSHTINENVAYGPTRPAAWPKSTPARTDEKLFTYAYYCSYAHLGTSDDYHEKTIDIYGYTLNKAFATVLNNIQVISYQNTHAIITTYNALNDRISNISTSGDEWLVL